MISSKDVFQKRKAGELEEAYTMGLERMAAADRDAWDVRAFGWCLVDLVKKFAADRPGPELNRYARELSELVVPPDDEVLTKQRAYVLSLLQVGAKDLQKARALSKAGEFRQAVRIYAEVFARGALDRANHTNYGWDLFKATRQVMQQQPKDQWSAGLVAEAKRYLGAYMKLEVDRPSMLHSCVLQQALRLASGGHLKVMVFARMWGLENLRAEDYERYVADDGKARSSLAEMIVQQAAKEAVADHQFGNLDYILPFVDRTMERFPDNVWLRLNKVKILRELGRKDDAQALAIEFAKMKTSEYWAWELLGDLLEEPSQSLACYCKALVCSQDDNFVSGVRLKLARRLADAGHHLEAKGEIQRVIEHKEGAGHRLPPEARRLAETSWYSKISSVAPQSAFYARFAPQADELLFSNLPWIDACVGERFVIVGREAKPLRKLYLKTTPYPTEVSIPESKLRLKNASCGLPIKVKGEDKLNGGRRFTLFAIEPRDYGADFDVFSETIGVIDNVNLAKGVVHFIASREAHGTYPLANYAGEPALGENVALRLATYHSKNGSFVRVLSAAPTANVAGPHVRKTFTESVRVDNGMGFTEDGIFIPPDLVADCDIHDGDFVSGLAVLSHNKKRQVWGWKAILIKELVGFV